MFRETRAFSGFAVKDIDAARRFYGDTLGIETEDGPAGLGLKIHGGTQIFLYPKEDHVPATYTILNFDVPDINAAVDELVKRGITMEHYEGFEQDERGIARGLAAGQGPDIAWFTDPSGNILAVLQTE